MKALNDLKIFSSKLTLVLSSLTPLPQSPPKGYPPSCHLVSPSMMPYPPPLKKNPADRAVRRGRTHGREILHSRLDSQPLRSKVDQVGLLFPPNQQGWKTKLAESDLSPVKERYLPMVLMRIITHLYVRINLPTIRTLLQGKHMTCELLLFQHIKVCKAEDTPCESVRSEGFSLRFPSDWILSVIPSWAKKKLHLHPIRLIDLIWVWFMGIRLGGYFYKKSF